MLSISVKMVLCYYNLALGYYALKNHVLLSFIVLKYSLFFGIDME